MIENIYDSFEFLKNKKILIYGMGANTEKLLASPKKAPFEILGILDGFMKEGSFMGYPVFDFEEIKEGFADAMVIIARPGSSRIIYNRVKKHAGEIGLSIYSADGKLMGSSTVVDSDHPYFELSASNILEKIDSCDVVSFDIFDTVLMRKVLFPTDVFYNAFIDFKEISDVERFVSSRIRAERELLSKGCSPTIYEIYEYLEEKGDISHNLSSECIKREIETEKKVICARKDMKKIIRYASDHNKKIFFTSDMFYPKEIMKELLEICGITFDAEILVSCDQRAEKERGLFNILKERAPGSKICHMGDNENADIKAAEECGIEPVRIYSAYDMLMISQYASLSDHSGSLAQRNMLGIFIEKAFNSPFALYKSGGKIKVESVDEYAYLFFAPLCASLVLFINNICHEQDMILFAARDGKIFDRIYDILCPEKGRAKHTYFLTSRSSVLRSFVREKEDPDFVMRIKYSGDTKDLLRERFGLDMDYDGSVTDEIFKEILKVSEENRSNLLKYLDSLDLPESPVFFDLVSTGTTQVALEKILERKLRGIYLLRMDDDSLEKRKLNVESFVPTECEIGAKSNIGSNYFILEKIFTDVCPTIRSFDEKGEPVFYPEKRSDEEIKLLKKIHDSIESYIRNNGWLLLKAESEGIEPADSIFGFSDPENIVMGGECELYYKTALIDEYCNRTIKF